MNLIAALNDLGYAISTKFDSVNSGGCGVVAAFVAQCLEWCNVESQIKVQGYGNKHIDYHRAHLDVPSDEATAVDWNNAGMSIYHVVVEFNLNGTTYHFDSNGVIPAGTNYESMPIADGSLTVDEMLTMISVPVGWNTRFDRNQIPDMMETIAKHLSQL